MTALDGRTPLIRIPVVCHFVHQTVLHGLGCLRINLIFPPRREVLRFLNLFRPHPLRDSYHPKEFIDVVSGISDEPAKDDKHVVDIMLAENWVCLFLWARHSLANGRNVCYAEKIGVNSHYSSFFLEKRTIVPGSVIDERWAVRHTCDLVTVVPPTHDDSILWCVLTKPVISFTEVVNNVL